MRRDGPGRIGAPSFLTPYQKSHNVAISSNRNSELPDLFGRQIQSLRLARHYMAPNIQTHKRSARAPQRGTFLFGEHKANLSQNISFVAILNFGRRKNCGRRLRQMSNRQRKCISFPLPVVAALGPLAITSDTTN